MASFAMVVAPGDAALILASIRVYKTIIYSYINYSAICVLCFIFESNLAKAKSMLSLCVRRPKKKRNEPK